MSEIIAVKVSRELKKKMKTLKKEVNWPEEIRRFIEAKVREVEAKKTIERITREIENTEGVPKGFVVKLVREDRESH
ncbi:MAG: CopG family transcriptional regulator [Candidatus Brockarchaeota archaeon]|nr:CopG family transcriptional regulator [Candidatus Brockarchaeota archaeon]MBO3808154.1 CopG family transcriptional regulator [Candidatus Brockarchaeota archaeon]MBO3832981.1 CopG family transcriptional regulator [Candidatus Brockarchaeota archaeon]MBO3841806.1 CopG family transcriptional regulator [Candidatus Brockarchaeota archaeon]